MNKTERQREKGGWGDEKDREAERRGGGGAGMRKTGRLREVGVGGDEKDREAEGGGGLRKMERLRERERGGG